MRANHIETYSQEQPPHNNMTLNEALQRLNNIIVVNELLVTLVQEQHQMLTLLQTDIINLVSDNGRHHRTIN
jgi:hypothetical protein